MRLSLVKIMSNFSGDHVPAGSRSRPDDARPSEISFSDIVGDQQAAEHQQHHLDDVGQRNGLEAAVERIRGREQRPADTARRSDRRPVTVLIASEPSQRMEVRLTNT